MHLLIVEDDRTIAENIYEYLESRGHQCDYADRIAVALPLLARNRFDALILDLNLPDGDGLSLARRLRTEQSALPILVLTAREMLEDKLLAFESGGDDYLVKPFALQELEVRLLALARRGPVRPTPPGTSGRAWWRNRRGYRRTRRSAAARARGSSRPSARRGTGRRSRRRRGRRR